MTFRRGRIVLALLAVLLVASLWRTVSVEREKQRLAQAYQEAQQVAKQLSDEYTHLSSELGEARKTVEAQTTDLSSLRQELKSVQDRLNTTVEEIAALQREHEQLRHENVSLTTKLSSVMLEKQRLEMRLSSLHELKLAIRDVRSKVSAERWAAWRTHIQARKQKDQERLAMGNRGYVVRSGRSTLGVSPRLHVHVLEPQAQ